jgi:hypothetical protein
VQPPSSGAGRRKRKTRGQEQGERGLPGRRMRSEMCVVKDIRRDNPTWFFSLKSRPVD